MISGYDCDLMHRLYTEKGWKLVKFPSKKNNIRSSLVTECIWMNYDYPRLDSPKYVQTKIEF